MNDVIQKIYDIGIVPVIAIDDADKAVPLAKALVKGGLPAAEVTFRTAAAEEAIKRIVAEVPEMLVGAGTVLTKEQADRAIAAGVKFIVSPGFNPEITKYVIDKGMLMMPGTATPGEMEQAMSMGLDVVKFFPAEQNGGVAKLKAVAGPYTNLRWMPTGGVNAKNLLDYLSFNKIVACGGTWMVKKDLIEAENWDEIERLTREAVNTMLGFEVKHIGINTENAEEAMKAAKLFELMFGFDDDACARKRAAVEHGAVGFLHPQRAAPAADIAGDLIDIGHMEHGYAFFAHAFCGLLQVQLGQHGHDEYKVAFSRALCDQCFKHAGGVLPHFCRN